jgi:hypothetical protein
MDAKLFLAREEFFKLDSIEDTIEDIKLILDAYTEVIQSMYDSKIDLKEGEVFIETLSVKIMLACRSILKLAEGYIISSTQVQGDIKLLDFSSINVITRSVIEAFLTLEYLFFNELEDSEKVFRFYIWRISGYKSRQNFFESRGNLRRNILDKLEEEEREIFSLLEKIISSPYYKDLGKQNLWKLDKFGLPRIVSWQTLLADSMLETSFFSIPYKLYSNYAHSEFISLIQMNTKHALLKGSEENDLNIKNSLRTIKMICCVSIILLKSKYECTSSAYSLLQQNIRDRIEFWYKFATR